MITCDKQEGHQDNHHFITRGVVGHLLQLSPKGRVGHRRLVNAQLPVSYILP